MDSQDEEPVRLPGMINFDLEGDELDPEKVHNLRLNIPLQISVGELGAGVEVGKPRTRGVGGVFPSSKITHGSRSESVEARQRKRTRDWLEGKIGNKFGSEKHQRVRSVSAGRDKRTEMAARYWAVLFENLRRAVDDLYRTCEGDESCIAAKEVVMVLENYTKDFTNLINWLKLKIEYESTPQPQRPTSLTWDIRKTSPLGRATPCTTPSKLTPTKQLLLTSPAKRQLNFEPKQDRSRSRKVSETIEEVEYDNSPNSSAPIVDCVSVQEIENENDKVSEYEKSDSEQEKDTPVVEIEEDSVSSVTNNITKSDETKNKDVAPQTEAAKEPQDCTRALKGDTKKTGGKVESKMRIKVPKTSDISNNTQKTTGKVSSTRPVSVDKVSTKLGIDKSTQKVGSDKAMVSTGLKTDTKQSTVTSIKSTTTDMTISNTAKREKSTEKNRATSKTKTFASTVKTSAPKPVVTTSGPSAVKPTNPRLTRALTNITSFNRVKPPSRKTAAGLLMTTTPLNATRSTVKKDSTVSNSQTKHAGKSTTSGGFESPKHQRISLVARQTKFAIENHNPKRKSQQCPPDRVVPGNGPSHQTTVIRSENSDTQVPHGSTSSLNSGSSGLSWADCVRGKVTNSSDTQDRSGQPGLLHCSAEDLSEQGSRRKAVDSDGWCTVRRARTRVSPASSAIKKGGKINHAKNRFKMPSSAMSMPSLAIDDIETENCSGEEEATTKPVLEKSSSSASIVLVREKCEVSSIGLAKLDEKGNALEDDGLFDEPSKVKKKKDLINHCKQKAFKKSQDGDKDEMSKLERKVSCPTYVESSIPSPESLDIEGDTSAFSKSNESIITTKSVEITKDIVDPEGEAIAEREKAIAKVDMEVNDLQRERIQTEQEELTDTDCDNTDTDNYTTDTDTADTRSETGTVSDINNRYEALLEGLSWAEQKELEDQLDDPNSFEARVPGRALQLHEKLSSPARKREPHETFKHYQEKQDRARLRRLMFGEKKANKLLVLNLRIEEAMEQRDKLEKEQKEMIDKKLRKAEEKRILHIEGIRKKAHEEEEKLKEIAFINSLEAQNQRMDKLTKVEHADEKCEERLAEIAEERAKKAEQREEREAKAEERRKAMEEERQKQIDAMVERRREKEERIQEEQAAAREQRKVSAAIKDKTRLERLSTVRAAEKDMKEELQEKIQQKQEDAAKRHAEIMDHIRQKAWELSVQKCSSDEGVPLITPYEVPKKCEACKVLIKSEVHLLSHLRGKQHQAEILNGSADRRELSDLEKTTFNLKNIVDAGQGETDPSTLQHKERLKAAKKKAKKLKSKMASRAAEYESGLQTANKHLDSPNRAKIGKSLREIEKLLSSQGKGAWPNNSVSALDRSFGEIIRSMDKKFSKDQDVFHALGGFDTLGKIYDMLGECRGETTCVIPIKSLVSAGNVLIKSTQGHSRNTEYLLMSNRLSLVADILLDRLARLTPEEGGGIGPETDPLSSSLMSLLSANIDQLVKDSQAGQTMTGRLQDLVSYIVCSGTVDSLASYFQLVRDPIDSSPEVAQFLLNALQLLTSLTAAIESGGETSDPTHLLAALRGTELAGTVSMLYGMLLHQGRDSDRLSVPLELPSHTLAVVMETVTLLLRLVQRQLSTLQSVLGQEGISLEFRHIASYLLYYCQHFQPELLNKVILLVGFFTANKPDNQSIVQSGSQPSVLQQLANLPFQYFSQPHLKEVLFPTLLASCNNNSENMNILTQEMSWQLIEEYVQSEEGRENLLVQLVVS